MDADDLLPISGLQHLLFCERQCALIHVEQAWADNHLTVEGKHLHENVDKPVSRISKGVRVATRLPLRSNRLRLSGYADVVEFHASPAGEMPFPVEYKRGKPKRGRYDEVQLCAQALCLEEMLNTTVPSGALFYGASRRRIDVVFNSELRHLTEKAAERFHHLIATGYTPPPVHEPKCASCSLKEVCLPEMQQAPDTSTYMAHLIAGETEHE